MPVEPAAPRPRWSACSASKASIPPSGPLAPRPCSDTPEVVRLDPDRLDARIAPIGYIVAGPGSVRPASTDEAWSTLTGWVRDGGACSATAPISPRSPSRPAGPCSPERGSTLTRLGRRRAGSDSASPEEVTREEWSRSSATPRGRWTSSTPPAWVFEAGLVVAASTGQEAAVPALPWLLGGILLFIVLVGPVNMLVLRAVGKPEWSWATIPVLSVVFLVGFWFVGRSQVIDYTASHASVVVDDGAGRRRRRHRAAGPGGVAGEHVLALGDGWQALPSGAARRGGDDRRGGRRRPWVFDLADLGLGSTRVRWEADPVDLETKSLAPASTASPSPSPTTRRGTSSRGVSWSTAAGSPPGSRCLR